MLVYHRTNLLESNAQTLVNTVNCVGVVGKGLAAEFKRHYPEMFLPYQNICATGQLVPGKIWLWRSSNRWILNFPTKRHWRNPSKLEWIEAGLVKFVTEYSDLDITEIAFPRLGCGNGGLSWDDVRPLMERHLMNLPINVYIHDYEVNVGLPEHFEELLRQLGTTLPATTSFETFTQNLRKVIEFADGRLVTLASRQRFEADFSDRSTLVITFDGQRHPIGMDDLRGLWLALTSGLVTREKVERSAGAGADQMLSMISLLPGVRPVEIQQPRSPAPEIAIELKPNPGLMSVGDPQATLK
jgi:O-acetyl-ADP-ribose deacetylase (regulator of RNase III)